MKYFDKVPFYKLSDKQKINAMSEMLNHLCGSNDYIQSSVDKEWTFEIVSEDYLLECDEDRENNLSHKVVVENIEHINYLKRLNTI